MNETLLHTQAVSILIQNFETNLKQGLSTDAAVKRFQEFGANEIDKAEQRHPLRILRDQFLSPMILLLMAVIVISIGIQHFTDAAIIGVIVVLNAWIGFFQEFRAELVMKNRYFLQLETLGGRS